MVHLDYVLCWYLMFYMALSVGWYLTQQVVRFLRSYLALRLHAFAFDIFFIGTNSSVPIVWESGDEDQRASRSQMNRILVFRL